jgi:hypothetical protein
MMSALLLASAARWVRLVNCDCAIIEGLMVRGRCVKPHKSLFETAPALGLVPARGAADH